MNAVAIKIEIDNMVKKSHSLRVSTLQKQLLNSLKLPLLFLEDKQNSLFFSPKICLKQALLAQEKKPYYDVKIKADKTKRKEKCNVLIARP